MSGRNHACGAVRVDGIEKYDQRSHKDREIFVGDVPETYLNSASRQHSRHGPAMEVLREQQQSCSGSEDLGQPRLQTWVSPVHMN